MPSRLRQQWHSWSRMGEIYIKQCYFATGFVDLPDKGCQRQDHHVAGMDDDPATRDPAPFNHHSVPAMQKFSLAPPTETEVLMERGI